MAWEPTTAAFLALGEHNCVRTVPNLKLIMISQSEGGDSDAVFLLKDGATLKNVIIGKDQSEGVHCGKFEPTLQQRVYSD